MIMIETLTLAAHRLRPIDGDLAARVQSLALAGPCELFASYCERMRRNQPHNAEFWHRLAGSVRKAATMR